MSPWLSSSFAQSSADRPDRRSLSTGRWSHAIESPMSAQYVSDEAGRRTAVLLPIEDYERLLEDLQDLAAIAERRDEPTVSHDDLVAELKRDGLLPA
jgi:hypothetical protein